MDSEEKAVKRYAADAKRMAKQGEHDKLATRVRRTAYEATTALGQLQAFSLDELRDVVESQPGMQQEVGAQLKALQDRMQELLTAWELPKS